MEVRIVCPLGSECEKAVDGAIERCAWYVKLSGHDPQSGVPIDEWRCSMAWQPILMIESNKQSMVNGASIQSLRNETVKRQQAALEAINAKVLTNK